MALQQQLDPDLERMVQQRRMGYLGEQALLRSINQQRMLQGLEPVADIASAVGGRPGKVRQTEAPPMQVPTISGGGPQVTSYTPPQDNSLAQALSGIGSGGGIQQMLQNMRGARAVPTPNVTRGQDLPAPPGTRAAPAGSRPAPRSVTDILPGLETFDASKEPPNTTAMQAYSAERTPGPAVRGVPAPPKAEASPGSSGILARQRAPYAAEMASNPAVKEKMMALMLAEEGGDREARTALAESAMNRGNSRNISSIDKVLDPRYYQPMHDGSGNYEKALARIRNDPKLRAEIEQDLTRAHGGSNVSKLATDNASAGVAKNSMGNQTHTHTTANGESWFRKDVRPDVHGALAVKQTKDWHDNTVAALVDEKPEPPAAEQPADTRWAPAQVEAQRVISDAASKPQGFPEPAPAQTAPEAKAPAEPPQWLKDSVGNYAVEKGLPPGNVGSVDPQPAPQQLTADMLKEHGEKMLAERAAQQPAQPLTMSPEIGKAAINATQPSAPKSSNTLKSALWAGTRGDQGPPIVEPPKPDLQAPPPPPAPIVAQDDTPAPQAQAPTLPAGNAPQPMIDAAVTGQIPPQLSAIPEVQTNWEPPAQVQQSQLGLQMQPFGQGNLSPIPWDWMGGWGWGAPAGGFDAGGFGGDWGGGGGFGSGFSGFDFFGGGNMGGW